MKLRFFVITICLIIKQIYQLRGEDTVDKAIVHKCVSSYLPLDKKELIDSRQSENRCAVEKKLNYEVEEVIFGSNSFIHYKDLFISVHITLPIGLY